MMKKENILIRNGWSCEEVRSRYQSRKKMKREREERVVLMSEEENSDDAFFSDSLMCGVFVLILQLERVSAHRRKGERALEELTQEEEEEEKRLLLQKRHVWT